MRVLVELSGEHPTLPRAEALAALESEGAALASVGWSSRILRLEATGPVERALRRVGLAHVVSQELASGSLDDVRAHAREMDLAGATFRVRAHSQARDFDARAAEGALGADLGRTGRVDLTRPTLDLRLLVGDEAVLGRVIHRVDRSGLESRRVRRRALSPPFSLHPKLARALVNLARVPTAGTVLDPFCGVGGIVLEAATVGLRPIGADLRGDMAAAARRALEKGRSAGDVVRADAGTPPWRGGLVHGIATDPPYGRAASTRGEPRALLYDRAFAAFAEILSRGRHAAVVLPDDRAIAIAEGHLELLEAHPLRVHRSLTRTFCAFRRP